MEKNQNVIANVRTYSERALYVKINRALARDGRYLVYQPAGLLVRRGFGQGPYFILATGPLAPFVEGDTSFGDLYTWAASKMPELFAKPKRPSPRVRAVLELFNKLDPTARSHVLEVLASQAA